MKTSAIATIIVLLFGFVSALATDNFVRGYTFDGATGEKTGADLEDLVTQAYLNRNDTGTNRIYDNITINLDSSSPPRLQIKDYSVSSTKIATGGVASVNIADGTIETNDLSTNTIAWINTNLSSVYDNQYTTNELRSMTNSRTIVGWAYGQGTTNSDCIISVPFKYMYSNLPYVVCMNTYLQTNPPTAWTNEAGGGTASGFNFVHLQQVTKTNFSVTLQYRTSAFAKQNMSAWYFGLNYIVIGE